MCYNCSCLVSSQADSLSLWTPVVAHVGLRCVITAAVLLVVKLIPVSVDSSCSVGRVAMCYNCSCLVSSQADSLSLWTPVVALVGLRCVITAAVWLVVKLIPVSVDSSCSVGRVAMCYNCSCLVSSQADSLSLWTPVVALVGLRCVITAAVWLVVELIPCLLMRTHVDDISQFYHTISSNICLITLLHSCPKCFLLQSIPGL